jgi:hypothetical protein
MYRRLQDKFCRMPQLAARLLVACSAFAVIPSSAGAQPVYSSGPGPHTLRANDVTINFTSLSGKATNDEDRVDSIIWGPDVPVVFVANEPANGPERCGDPVEYFGQAEGYPDTTQPPRMVVGGQRASYYAKANSHYGLAVAKIYTGLATCSDVQEDGLVRSVYSLSANTDPGNYYDAFKIERTLRFKAGLGVVKNTGLRAYIPRVLGSFRYVLVPNKAGKLVTYDSASCVSSPCAVTDWNGVWFADYDGGSGGIIVTRDPSSTVPAFIGIQSGGLSNANFSSIVLEQPSAGWSGVVTETEHVCFFASGSWNPSTTLPFGCNHPATQ